MLEPIGESVVRTTMRADNHHNMNDNKLDLEKVSQKVDTRAVEDSQESSTPQSDAEHETGGYNADEQGIFFAKYDKNGNVIYRLPPEQKPIDERA